MVRVREHCEKLHREVVSKPQFFIPLFRCSRINHQVVKLFNVIQQSQTDASVAVEKTKAARGSGKPSLPAPTIPHKTKGKAKAKEKDNVLGRGKEGMQQ